jgi:probable phosphoglycerate mutase
MTLLILARHGNTFEAGEEARWVGARSDLPLTAKGREQAAAIGAALREAGLIPARTLAGPLKRTRETATIALDAAGASRDQIEIDERLREIDYGAWEGRSSAEIRQAGDGDAELDAWESEGAWPVGAGWPLSREIYLRNLLAVVDSVRMDRAPTLVVSSNGLFRLLACAIAGNGCARKMGTGRLALLSLTGADGVVIIGWNLTPDDFPACAVNLSIGPDPRS